MKECKNGCAIFPAEKAFKFSLGQLVNLRISDEWGEV